MLQNNKSKLFQITKWRAFNYISIGLLLSLCGCATTQKNSKANADYTLYPYTLFSDTVNKPYGILVPVRLCTRVRDTEYIYIDDIAHMKYITYKDFSYDEFYSSIVKRIYGKKCLNLNLNAKQKEIIKISREEYRTLNPDTLLTRYFVNGKYGDINDDEGITPLPREIQVAFVILFDNNYIISKSHGRNWYHVHKAITDAEVKRRQFKITW